MPETATILVLKVRVTAPRDLSDDEAQRLVDLLQPAIEKSVKQIVYDIGPNGNDVDLYAMVET